MKARKSNSYTKILFIMLIAGIAGGILGTGMYLFLGHYGQGIEGNAARLMEVLQAAILPVLGVITVLSVIAGETVLRKLRNIMARLAEAEDEEADRLDYEEEKYAALSTNMNILSQIVCLMVLSLGYSSNYIGSSDSARGSFLCACLVFLVCMVYDSFWQIRYLKMVQRLYPDRNFDPASKSFRRQWLESCDEAEREIIYRSAYKAYTVLSGLLPFLILTAMLGNLFFNTGIFAVILVAVIWLTLSLSYSRSSVALKGEKALMK